MMKKLSLILVASFNLIHLNSVNSKDLNSEFVNRVHHGTYHSLADQANPIKLIQMGRAVCKNLDDGVNFYVLARTYVD